MRAAILETFPEPNRRLLQRYTCVLIYIHFVKFNCNKYIKMVDFICRILKMMHTVSSHSFENRMTPSAVAACMAPLLLRPLLAGECESEDEFDNNGDNSAQLLAAANAANNAQAIITTLLEEYETVFDVNLLLSFFFLIFFLIFEAIIDLERMSVLWCRMMQCSNVQCQQILG